MGRTTPKKWTVLVNAILIVLVVLWAVPIIGLFISSLRPKTDVLNSGWWTIFSSKGRITLEN